MLARAAQPGCRPRIAHRTGTPWKRSMSRVRIFRPTTAPAARIPREWVRPPDFAEFHRWQEAAQGHVRIDHALARVAGRAALHRADHRARRSGRHRPHARDAGSRSAMRWPPAQRCPPTSATEPAAPRAAEDFIDVSARRSRASPHRSSSIAIICRMTSCAGLSSERSRPQHPGDRRRRSRSVRAGTLHAGRRRRRIAR